MKSLLKWALLIAAIFLGSAVLAPLLHTVMPFFKFEKIFNRLVMIFSVTAAIFFVRSRGNVLEGYGLMPSRERFGMLAAGFASGFLVLAGLLGIRIVFGTAAWVLQGGGAWLWISEITNNLAAGLLIGLIEEFFFRGFVYSLFKKDLSWNLAAAVTLTSFLYAAVHFLSPKKPYIDSTPTVIDSFRLMAAPMASWADASAIWPGLLGLFLFGVILNQAAIRSRSLYPAIGLHAGCVFFLKSQSLFADVSSNGILWGGTKMYDGLAGWVALVFLGILLNFTCKFRKQPEVEHA